MFMKRLKEIYTAYFWIFFILGVLFYSLYALFDYHVHLGYVLDEVERVFHKEYPRFGSVLYFSVITVPQFLISLFIVLILTYIIKRWLLRLSYFSSINRLITRFDFHLFDIKKGQSYEQILTGRFFVFGLIFFFLVGVYYLIPLSFEETDRFQFQLVLGRVFVVVFVLYWLLMVFKQQQKVRSFLKSYLFEPGNAYNLAIARILLFSFVFLLYGYKLIFDNYWAEMPKEAMVFLPFTGWWAKFIPISGELYTFATALGMLLSFMAVLGIGSRWVMLLNIAVGFYVLGVPLLYGKLFHIHIWYWFPVIFAFSRSADVLSIDALINKYRGVKRTYATNHPVYGLPIKIVLLHYGIIYFFAGIIKLWDCGFDWALSQSVINQMQVEWIQHYNKIPSVRIDLLPGLVKFGSLLVIAFEILFPFLILSKRIKYWAFIGGLIFHNVVGYFMYIGFTDLQISYLLIVNWVAIVAYFRKNNPVPEQVHIKDAWNLNFKKHKVLLFFGLGLFTLNFTAGVFRIHSWPFSSYPTYSMLVKDTHSYIYFEAYDEHGRFVNVDSLGHENDFRKESFTPVEDRIGENLEAEDTLSLRTNIQRLWTVWESNVPELVSVSWVQVWWRESPVSPEERHRLLKNEYILTFNPREWR